MSNIIGKCQKCGCRYDFLRSRCPNCRLQDMQKAFAPIDPLRTALGIQGLSEDAELGGVWHYYGEPWHGLERESEVPRGCKLPKSEEAQVWELRRMFRL